jgi:hypothetical protein
VFSEDISSKRGASVTDEACGKAIADSDSHHSNSSSTVLKLSVLALLLVVTSGMAPGQAASPAASPANIVKADQPSTFGPCNVTQEEAAGLDRALSSDLDAVRDYEATIARILKEEKFEELDCLADRARSSKERFPGGMWKLHVLYRGLYSVVQDPVKHATQEDFDNHIQRLQRWAAARPKSITPRVALAGVYLDYAVEARGNGFANTVSDSGWKLFGERTAEAKRILDEASTLPTKCPEWYLGMQSVGQNQDWDAARQRTLFEEASKFEPDYHYYARTLAGNLLPKWGGEPGDTEKFVQEVADRIGGDQGDILYFQVAITPTVICGCNDNPHLSWERIERGFEASEKQYGVSMLNLNRIAFLAAHFGDDPVTADKALTRIGEQWDEETWSTKGNFDQVKTFASQYAPIVAKRRAMEAAADAKMQTPQGRAYQVSFERTYRKFAKQCAHVEKDSVTQEEGKFETLTSVGVTGTVEDVKIQSNSPAAVCLYEKLHGFQLKHATPFAPPPQAPYLVKLELDWAEFTPVAAK